MSKSMIVARLLEDGQLECRVRSNRGTELVLTGGPLDLEPHLEGAEVLSQNRALVHNAWAFAKFTHDSVTLPTEKEQELAGKRAEGHRRVTRWTCNLADNLTSEARVGWCSVCFSESEHRKVDLPVGHLPAHLCANCGSATSGCVAPGCMNMAIRGRGPARVPRYCAEHRHDIPSFAKATDKIGTLDGYGALLEYERRNLRRGTRIAGVGLTALAGGAGFAWFGAEAIGGAIGSVVSSYTGAATAYTGAAATSYGLALLGGGSLATGGLGVAGGTFVVAAFGGALGGALGASVANAYLQEDSSFHIELLQDGPGVPVVVCNGFLSEKDTGWDEWEAIVSSRYPDSPVYRVYWGAKELKDLGMLVSASALKASGKAAIRKAAEKATKEGAKVLGPLTPLLVGAGLAKNPWHVAKNRADKTGIVVADLLARTNSESYVLVGHSLGARAMVVAAQTLGSKQDAPRIQSVHLLGPAIGAKGDWHTLNEAVDEAVYNYHSSNDVVLKYVYRLAQGGQTAAGCIGFNPEAARLHNIDVSECVNGHSEYHSSVTLR